MKKTFYLWLSLSGSFFLFSADSLSPLALLCPLPSVIYLLGSGAFVWGALCARLWAQVQARLPGSWMSEDRKRLPVADLVREEG